MDNARKWLTTPFLVLYALWAMLFYQLAFTAWTLEYSYYGVLAVLAACLVFIFAFPRKDRRLVVRFTLFCLAGSLGLASFNGEPLSWRVIDYVLFLVFALILGRLLVGVRVRRLFIVLLALTLVELWVPLSDMSVLSAFNVSYIGHLESPDTQLPNIPIATIPSSTSPGRDEIITLRGHAPAKGEAQDILGLLADPEYQTTGVDALKELQHSYDVMTVVPGKLNYHEEPATQDQLSQMPVSTLGLIDFPFTTTHFLNVNGTTRMYLSLSAQPGELLQQLLSPGTLVDSLGQLSLQTATSEAQSWSTVTRQSSAYVDGLTIDNGYLSGSYGGRSIHVATSGLAILGVYRLLPNGVAKAPQAIVEGNNMIQVISLPPDRARVVATLHGTYSQPLTKDIVFADLTGTHYGSLLVNTVPAQILTLTPDGIWNRLWVSNRTSFRFETVFPETGGDLIIANSPSLVSPSPIRYLGGYKYKNHTLVPVFRVFHGDFVDLHAVNVTSSSRKDLLTSVYAHQEIMLLSPTRIPWLGMIYAGYILAVLVGLVRRAMVRGRSA